MFNNLTYNRRLSVLNALMKKHRSKQMLKDKASIFSENHKDLFGQNLRKDWCTDLNTKQKYQKVLRKETKLTLRTFSRNRPPFRRGPPASLYARRVVEGVHYKRYSFEQCHKHRGSMVRVTKSLYLNTQHFWI